MAEKIIKVMGVIVGLFIVVIIFLIFLSTRTSLFKVAYLCQPKPKGPYNQAELCEVLGKGPDVDPTCPERGRGDIVYETFPKGIATREEIREVLEEYFIESDGNMDIYAIQWVLFGSERALFVFDEDGILKHINWES